MKKIFSLFLMLAVFSASLFAATYTVAGSSSAAFGSAWDPKNTDNDMTLVDGVYTLVKEGVTLSASTLEYKVCQDYAWATCWPSGDNAKLVISEAGKYTLTFTFNLEKGAVNATAQKTEEAQVDPKVSIKGAWDSWAEAIELNLATDKKSASYVMEVAAPTSYEFKVIVGDGGWRSNEHEFTRDDASSANITGNSNINMKLVADVAGNYTFTWTFASNTLVVAFPEKGDDPVTPDPETPVDSMTVYFYNNLGWKAVNGFVWPAEGNAYVAWPGEAAKKEAEKINDIDVYAYTFPASYVNVIFNNGTDQTIDLAWDAEKPYFVANGTPNELGKYEGKWYAKADIPADEPAQPEADFTKPFVLTFNGTGESGKDASAAFTADVAAIFDAASAPYVASVETATKVYAGRPIADDNSSVKFGTTSAQGSLAFTLAQAIEVDSIIVNATQYGNNAAKITINGTEFELNAGNKKPQDSKITPEGKVSAISIAQSTSERLYLRNVRVYPKTSTPEPPTPGTVYYMKNNWGAGADWTWKAMTQDGETYKLESVIFGGNGVNYNTAESDKGATWVPADQILGDKIAAKDTVTFVLDPVAKTVTATLVSAGGDTPEPPTPGTVYYMKNNWGAGADWTWKAMTQDGETYKLESVIFGGNGVNYNTAESDEGATWVPADQIQGDKIAANDTVTFVLDPVAKTVTATLVSAGGDTPEPPTPGEYTYTVAGSSADAFGTAWAPTNTDNDMSLVEGLYTWEKADLTLAAGTIEFKVCEDHAWTTAYPGENYKLNIPEAGIYTITITFNASTKEVNAVATKTGSAVVVPSIAMHGNFTGSWVDTEKFTVAEGNATASLTLNLAAGNYEFGVRINGTWTSNGVAFARANASAVVVAGQGNLTLAADAAGEYTFTWTYETNTLAITFPTATGIEETIAAGKAAKVLRNGQIFILKGDKMYNVMGATIK